LDVITTHLYPTDFYPTLKVNKEKQTNMNEIKTNKHEKYEMKMNAKQKDYKTNQT